MRSIFLVNFELVVIPISFYLLIDVVLTIASKQLLEAIDSIILYGIADLSNAVFLSAITINISRNTDFF